MDDQAVSHTCPRCGQCYARHNALVQHLNRAIPCPDLLGFRQRLAKRQKVALSVSDTSSELGESTSKPTRHDPSRQPSQYSPSSVEQSNKSADSDTEETIVLAPKDDDQLENKAASDNDSPDFLDECDPPVNQSAVPTLDELSSTPFFSLGNGPPSHNEANHKKRAFRFQMCALPEAVPHRRGVIVIIGFRLYIKHLNTIDLINWVYFSILEFFTKEMDSI